MCQALETAWEEVNTPNAHPPPCKKALRMSGWRAPSSVLSVRRIAHSRTRKLIGHTTQEGSTETDSGRGGPQWKLAINCTCVLEGHGSASVIHSHVRKKCLQCVNVVWCVATTDLCAWHVCASAHPLCTRDSSPSLPPRAHPCHMLT